MEAILEEIRQEKDYLKGEAIETIYFGGGTPSHVPHNYIGSIIQKINDFFTVDPNPEITLEANPDDISEDSLEHFLLAGVNRLSIGIQSFVDDDLKFLQRVHNASLARHAIELSRKAGFSNITADLIYGIPTLTDENWEYNLEQMIGFELEHISAYALTVEPKTALNNQIQKGKLPVPDESQMVKHFTMLTDTMQEAGYLHYEISNFCKKGFISKHNSNYWNGTPYLGIGPSAHSFNGNSRQWNPAHIRYYLEGVNGYNLQREKEELSQEQRYNEYIMTSIRTMWGVNSSAIKQRFGKYFSDHFMQESTPYIQSGMLCKTGDRFLLTKKGKLFADRISSQLFVTG
jgi:oxygen-independent coproporphyrinogen-3 oxidase